jgi:hypothetical protein
VFYNNYLASGKPIPSDVVIDSDHGSDSNYYTDIALLVNADNFRNNQLGTLAIVGPTGKASAHNEIEADWSPLKTAISGLILSDTVGTDDRAPDQQSDLTHEELVIKDLAVFKNAGETLKRAWTRLTVRGNPVEVRYSLPQVRPRLQICFLIQTDDIIGKCSEIH